MSEASSLTMALSWQWVSQIAVKKIILQLVVGRTVCTVLWRVAFCILSKHFPLEQHQCLQIGMVWTGFLLVPIFPHWHMLIWGYKLPCTILCMLLFLSIDMIYLLISFQDVAWDTFFGWYLSSTNLNDLL